MNFEGIPGGLSPRRAQQRYSDTGCCIVLEGNVKYLGKSSESNAGNADCCSEASLVECKYLSVCKFIHVVLKSIPGGKKFPEEPDEGTVKL